MNLKIYYLDAFFIRSLFSDLIKRTDEFSISDFFFKYPINKVLSILELYDNIYKLQDDILYKTLSQLFKVEKNINNYEQLLLFLTKNRSLNNNTLLNDKIFYNHLYSTWIVKPQSTNLFTRVSKKENKIITFLRSHQKLVLYGIMTDTRTLNQIYRNLFILNKFLFESNTFIPKEFVDYSTWVNIWLTKYLINNKDFIFNLGMCLPIRGLEKRTKRVNYFHYSVPFFWDKLGSSIQENLSKLNYLKLYKLLINTLENNNLSKSDKNFLLLSKQLLFSTRLSIFTKYNNFRSKDKNNNLNKIYYDFYLEEEFTLNFDSFEPLKVEKSNALVNKFDISINSQGILFGKLKNQNEYTPFVTITGMEFLYCITSLYMYLCLELSDSFYPLYLFSYLSPSDLFKQYPYLRPLLVPISRNPNIYLGNTPDPNTGHYNCSIVREDEIKYHELAKNINLWTIANYIVFNIDNILKYAQINGIVSALNELYKQSLLTSGKLQDKKTYYQFQKSLNLLNNNDRIKSELLPINNYNKWTKSRTSSNDLLYKFKPNKLSKPYISTSNLTTYIPPHRRISPRKESFQKYFTQDKQKIPLLSVPVTTTAAAAGGSKSNNILEQINKYNKKVLQEFNKKNKLKYKGLKKSELILEIKNKLL